MRSHLLGSAIGCDRQFFIDCKSFAGFNGHTAGKVIAECKYVALLAEIYVHGVAAKAYVAADDNLAGSGTVVSAKTNSYRTVVDRTTGNRYLIAGLAGADGSSLGAGDATAGHNDRTVGNGIRRAFGIDQLGKLGCTDESAKGGLVVNINIKDADLNGRAASSPGVPSAALTVTAMPGKSDRSIVNVSKMLKNLFFINFSFFLYL